MSEQVQNGGQGFYLVPNDRLNAIETALSELIQEVRESKVEQTFSINEVCEKLHISRGTFYNYVKNNTLKATRKPKTRQWITTRTALNEFLSRTKA